MVVMQAFQSRGLALQEAVHKWIALGFLVFLASMFYLGGNQQKTFFYFLVALPALFLLLRSRALFRQDAPALTSLILLFVFFSLSALWSGGEGSVKDAAKYSLYIYCLMLAIEAVTSRFSAEFITRFIVVVGAIAGCAYVLTLTLGDIPAAALITKRYSLYRMAGWGPSNPITSAFVFGVMAIAAWWLLPNRKWPVQLGLMALIGLAIALMFVTKSRGPLLALLIIFVLITAFRRSKIDLLLLLLGGALIAVVAALSNVDAVVAQRVASPNYRGEIWSAAFQQFQSHWLLGMGFGNDARILIGDGSVVTHAHSSLFETFRTGGLVGGVLFIGMTLLLLRHAWRKPSGHFFLLWLLYGVMCLSTNGRALLIKPSVEWFAFWIPLFLLFFVTRGGAHPKKSLEPIHAAS